MLCHKIVFMSTVILFYCCFYPGPSEGWRHGTSHHRIPAICRRTREGWWPFPHHSKSGLPITAQVATTDGFPTVRSYYSTAILSLPSATISLSVAETSNYDIRAYAEFTQNASEIISLFLLLLFIRLHMKLHNKNTKNVCFVLRCTRCRPCITE